MGRLGGEEKLSSLLYRMTPSDIYVKGVNALDREGNVGILFGLEGSMGYIQAARKKRKLHHHLSCRTGKAHSYIGEGSGERGKAQSL